MKKSRLLLLVLPLIVGVFYMRSLASWRPKKVFARTTNSIRHLQFSDNGQLLLVSPRLTALDLAGGFVPKWSYMGDPYIVKTQFFSDDSHILVAEEHGKTRAPPINIIDASTGHILHSYGMQEAAAISADGKWLASYKRDGIYLERADAEVKGHKTPDKIKIRAAPGESIPTVFAISPDSRTLVVQVTEFYQSRLGFYDISSGKRTRTWSDSNSRVFGQSIQWSRNGRYLLAVWFVHNGPTTRQLSWSLWRASDGQKLASTTFPFDEQVRHFEVEDDGRVLSYEENSQVLLSHPTTNASISKPILNIPSETITSATLSPDGSYLVAGTQSGRIYSQRIK
ncbi:hypothetical protein EON83_08405 [bacterium]|nr:MAG: hypothetical protein EON83_08405 [bacterium]